MANGPWVTNGKGLNVITDRLQSVPATYIVNANNTFGAPRFCQMGAGSGAARSANALTAPIGGKTSAYNSAANPPNGSSGESLVQTTVANDTYQVIGTMTASGTWGITEAALFTASASGTGDMFAYSDFGLVTLNSGDSLQLTWKVAFS